MQLTEITKELFDYLVKFRQRVAGASVPDLDIVRHEIELVFHGMEEKVSRQPKLATEYRAAKYPLVVLADEVILTSPWTHAKRWEQCLLEKKYYSSNIGGNQFFKLLSKIDKMPASVIMIFFYCLAFGFRGGFSQNDPSLIRLKGRLLHRVMPKKTSSEQILPLAYRLSPSGAARLPRLWKWRHLAIAGLLVFVALLALQRAVIWPLVIGSTINDAMTSDVDTDAVQTAAPVAKGFTVRLGQFSSETLAIHFSQQFEPKGLRPRIYYRMGADGQHNYLVLTGTFDNKEAAMNVMVQAKAVSTLVSEMAVLPLEEAKGDCIHGCN